MKKLSILICSLIKRDYLLQRLLNGLNPQVIPYNDSVEILINSDTGEKTIGKKRNELILKATGDYICFVDDDDLVSNDYVQKVLSAISSRPDCCGIEGMITFDGSNPKKFVHSNKYKTWFESRGVYYRNPNHLNPVKREYATRVGFPEISRGEDRIYSERILPFLKTERYIIGTIYRYLYSEGKNYWR